MHSLKTAARYACLLFVIGLASCATNLTIRADSDPRVDLSRYRTFAFLEPNPQAAYATLLYSRLREATRHELEKRGYQYAETNPQLWVNFHVKIQDRQELRAEPNLHPYGYYGYFVGLYDPWIGYPYDIYTVNYTVGTLTIDIVDAMRKQLVWQGRAEGVVTEKVRKNPDKTIDTVVEKIFQKYPVPARS